LILFKLIIIISLILGIIAIVIGIKSLKINKSKGFAIAGIILGITEIIIIIIIIIGLILGFLHSIGKPTIIEEIEISETIKEQMIDEMNARGESFYITLTTIDARAGRTSNFYAGVTNTKQTTENINIEFECKAKRDGECIGNEKDWFNVKNQGININPNNNDIFLIDLNPTETGEYIIEIKAVTDSNEVLHQKVLFIKIR
jgi:hypothetical protein